MKCPLTLQSPLSYLSSLLEAVTSQARLTLRMLYEQRKPKLRSKLLKMRVEDLRLRSNPQSMKYDAKKWLRYNPKQQEREE